MKWERYTTSVLICLLAVIIYLPTTGFDFAYDDSLVITGNPTVTAPAEGQNQTLKILLSPTPPGDLYRPVPALSYRFDYLFKGLDAGWFHGINTCLYALLCLLVLNLFQKLLPTSAAAFWAAVIFTVHPVHVEAVANIVGRAELLAGIGGIAALLLLINQWARPEKRFISLGIIASAVLFFLAVLSKESAFTFLPLYLAAALLIKGKPSTLTLHTVLAVLALYMRSVALGNMFLVAPESSAINPENPLLGLPFTSRLLPALKIQGDYLVSLIAPTDISPDYSIMFEQLFQQTWSTAGFLALLLFATLIFLTAREEDKKLRLCGIWFLITFLLTSNILVPIGTVRADRLLLVPGIGVIALLFSRAAVLWPERVTLIGAAVSAVFMLKTITLIPGWRDNGTLFSSMVTAAPENPKALYNLGIYLLTQQQAPVQAEYFLRKTLEIVPDHLYSMKALADISLARKDYARLAYWYTRILRSYPEEQQVREQLEKLNALTETKQTESSSD